MQEKLWHISYVSIWSVDLPYRKAMAAVIEYVALAEIQEKIIVLGLDGNVDLLSC